VIQNQGDHPERTVALPDRADIILIGGGHNGLTGAAYLALAGRDVLVLEAREDVIRLPRLSALSLNCAS